MKLEQITFTRFIAALTVVFFHFGTLNQASPTTHPFWGSVITAGPIAVSYFFALSGFIMAVAYYGSTRSIDAKQYWVARFARIYPVYLVALLLVLAFAMLKKQSVGLSTIAFNVSMLQAWLPPYAMTLNTPGWSLSVEAFFYLCFPFLLALLHRQSRRQMLLIFSIVLWFSTQLLQIYLVQSSYYTHPSAFHNFIFYHPLMHISTFLLGLLAGAYFCDGAFNRFQVVWNGVAILILLGLVIFALAYQAKLSAWLGFTVHYENGLIAPLFLAIIILLGLNTGWTQKVLNLPLLVLLGEASYSLYILQRPIYGIYDRLIGQALLNSNLRFYLFLFILVGISIASFYLLESPLRRFINRSYFLSKKNG
ncbi:acyltransferase family protein [Thiolinea disciformis]|uniref:acyltransferase family protein n=1 Tax=Thiolinea disciformis TaxID=125614 RepID=UPI00037FD7D4|nr:acyltransferase [Thiolinea disciformis]